MQPRFVAHGTVEGQTRRIAEFIANRLRIGADGRVVEPRMSIPGVGRYAPCAEPGGLCFGLIQADASAT